MTKWLFVISSTDGQLEEVVIKILADVDVAIETSDIEAAIDLASPIEKHQVRKLLFAFRKHCKRALLNRKKLAKVDSQKYSFSANNSCS